MSEEVVPPRVMAALPPSSDPLDDVLGLLRLSGVLYCRAELSAPWGIELPELPGCIMIHVVDSGAGWLEVAGQEQSRLRSGSLVMLAHGTSHRIRSAPDAPATPLAEIPVELRGDRHEVMSHGGGGDVTRITYCGIRLDHVIARRLLDVLPRVVRFGTGVGDDASLRQTVEMISREAGALRPGSDTIVTRLADVLVVQAIRAWVESTPPSTDGWLAALRDRHVGRALAAIHRAPARAWTLASIASIAGLSRSGFAARFTALVGQPAMHYVVEWRMQLARVHLRETDEPLARVAERFGYGSESAFSRAYRRVFGVPPGSVRRAGGI